MASAVMPLFTVACVLLVVGGASKVRAPRAGRQSLALVGVRVPASVVRALAALEIALGIAAAAAPRPIAAGLVAVAYGGFCGFGLRLLRVGAREECGCFGEGGANLGATHLILNATACVVAVLAALVHPPGVGWVLAHSPLDSFVAGIGIAAASLAVYAVFTLFPGAWRSYGQS